MKSVLFLCGAFASGYITCYANSVLLAVWRPQHCARCLWQARMIEWSRKIALWIAQHKRFPKLIAPAKIAQFGFALAVAIMVKGFESDRRRKGKR